MRLKARVGTAHGDRRRLAAAWMVGLVVGLVVAPAAAADPCPTLRWSPVPGAGGYELALFAVAAVEEPTGPPAADAILQLVLPEPLTAWRPTSAWCPRQGQSYVWTVRALAADEGRFHPVGPWSEPRELGGASPAAIGERRLLARIEALANRPEGREELAAILGEGVVGGAAPSAGTTSGSVAGPSGEPRRATASANAGGPVALGPHFLGTSDAQELELRLDGVRALLLRPTAGTANLVGGSSANSVTEGVIGATIAGGGSGVEINTVTDDFGTIGGGRGNTAGDGVSGTATASFATVGGGRSNSATSSRATVGGGQENVAAGTVSTVGGGLQNLAAGSTSAIGGGSWNAALEPFATIPGGRAAKARRLGQLAYAAGSFGGQLQPGDAQWSLYVQLAETVDDTPTRLFLAGVTLGGIGALTLEVGQTIAFRAQVSALSTTGDSAAYQVAGLIENVGGITSFIGTPVVTVLAEDRSNWDLHVFADDVEDSLVFFATGGEMADVRWVATVRATEVRF